MSDRKVLALADRVPIVGQAQPGVKAVQVLTVAMCSCGSKEPLVFPAVSSVVTCTGCKDEFFVAHLQVDAREAGEGALEIRLQRVVKSGVVTN